MKIIEKLKNLYEMAWNEDIPSPTTIEYLELHNKIQKILKEIEKIIKECENENNGNIKNEKKEAENIKILEMKEGNNMLKCRECKHAKQIQEVRSFESQYYWILCGLSGIAETCHLTEDYPKSCELLGYPPIRTSIKFKFCQVCGTYTINEKGCQNLNHKNNLDKLLKDDKI